MQHPSASPTLSKLAGKFSMPAEDVALWNPRLLAGFKATEPGSNIEHGQHTERGKRVLPFVVGSITYTGEEEKGSHVSYDEPSYHA